MIRFDHITKQYAGTKRPALDSIDLEILRGEFVFLVGASGSGKSSCLRLVLKEEKPSSGSIHVLGQDLRSISNRKVPYFRRNLGVVFQDFRLLPNKTVYENVAFSLKVIGKSRGFIQEAVPDTLKRVGLDEKSQRLPHELSGGEQQRVAIARAIVNKPQILLADEPTGNLDPTTSAGIMALLDRINASGTTVIMATHEAGIVDEMQRRVVELSAGQIVRDERQGGYATAATPTSRGRARAHRLPERVAGGEADAAREPTATNEPAVTHEPDPAAAPTSPASIFAPAPPEAAAFPEAVPAVSPVPDPEPERDAHGWAVDPEPAPPAPVVPAEPVTVRDPIFVAAADSGMPLPHPENDKDNDNDNDNEPENGNKSENAPATESELERPREAGENPRSAAGEARAPIRPELPAIHDDVTEQLTLAEKLGLRAPGQSPDSEEQNVGPTR